MLDKIIHNLNFIFYPLYLISFIVPKNKNVWLFGAGHDRYAENAKALFEYCSDHNKENQFIWITGSRKVYNALKSKGYRAELRWSLRGIYYGLTARYYFYNLYINDINFYTSGNTIAVNLWHGIPLKKIEFDIKQGAQSRIFNSKLSPIYHFFKPFIFKKPDYVLSTSAITSNIFASAFRIPVNRCLELGYPRCDVFYKNTLPVNTENQKTIIYMPTWRNDDTNFLDEAFPDFETLNSTLQKNDLRLYIKLHPNTETVNQEYTNIFFINPHTDIYDFLPNSDLLITDYSSIYFDYLLLDKEIVFYPFDYEKYINTDREFYFDYDALTPGETVYKFKHLIQVLNNLENLNYNKARKELRDTLWKYRDGHASKRILEYFT